MTNRLPLTTEKTRLVQDLSSLGQLSLVTTKKNLNPRWNINFRSCMNIHWYNSSMTAHRIQRLYWVFTIRAKAPNYLIFLLRFIHPFHYLTVNWLLPALVSRHDPGMQISATNWCFINILVTLLHWIQNSRTNHDLNLKIQLLIVNNMFTSVWFSESGGKYCKQ
jgi:hypothetical protein